MLNISMLVKLHDALESFVNDIPDMPGHLARRFQQIAVAVFLAEVDQAGYDLTPVQYAALAAVSANSGIDQVTHAGLIAYDRTTIRPARPERAHCAPRKQPGQAGARIEGHPCGTKNLERDHAGGRSGSAAHVAGSKREGSKGTHAPPPEGHRFRQRTEPGSVARGSNRLKLLVLNFC
jgi:hypothetical protein